MSYPHGLLQKLFQRVHNTKDTVDGMPTWSSQVPSHSLCLLIRITVLLIKNTQRNIHFHDIE